MNKDILVLAKNLRKMSTDAERVLWMHLKAKQLDGLRFRRQQPIGHYIVDFVCFEKRIIVELDGGQHNQPEGINKDIQRDAYLNKQDFRVLRFWNKDIFKNIDGVLESIAKECFDQTSSPLIRRVRRG